MGILEKISEIEREIARTQKNKGNKITLSYERKGCILINAHHIHLPASTHSATEYHLGLLKAKLAKYRAQLLEPSKSAGAAKVRNAQSSPSIADTSGLAGGRWGGGEGSN